MSDSSNRGSNLVFFLLGAAAGAGIALLYAPQEGEATRRLIGDRAGDLKDKAAEYSSTVAQQARDRWGNLTDTVSSKAHELIDRAQGGAQEAIDEAADKAHSAANGIA